MVARMTFRLIPATLSLSAWIIFVLAIHNATFPDPPVLIKSDGTLEYNTDERGDRVPDFSWCGYMASEVPVPDVPVKVIVRVSEAN